MDKREVYERWLLECVLIRGWTTVKCAREICAKPKDVLKDFNELCQRMKSEKRGSRRNV